jgi:small subunit ribosomal protein S8
LKRISKPGLRKYFSSKEIPSVRNGLGVGIITTSKGVLTDKEARENGVGGELICTVF